jgi:hypothetical protein
VRGDTFFVERQAGREATRAHADESCAWCPEVACEVLEPLAEAGPGTVKGGVNAIHLSDADGQPRDVRAVVLLEPSDEEISSEGVHYNAQSLKACGWAR